MSTSRLESELVALRTTLADLRGELERERALRLAAQREPAGAAPAEAREAGPPPTADLPLEGAMGPKVVPAEPVVGPTRGVRVETPLGAPVAETVEPPEPLPDIGRITAAVEAWASAWSGQRVDEYLSFYSRDFRPPPELTRAEWEAQRRLRLTRPRFIEIDLAAIGQRPLGDGRVSVRFRQTYRSDTFGDEVIKTLDLVWEDGGWKILDERAEAAP